MTGGQLDAQVGATTTDPFHITTVRKLKYLTLEYIDFHSSGGIKMSRIYYSMKEPNFLLKIYKNMLNKH